MDGVKIFKGQVLICVLVIIGVQILSLRSKTHKDLFPKIEMLYCKSVLALAWKMPILGLITAGSRWSMDVHFHAISLIG